MKLLSSDLKLPMPALLVMTYLVWVTVGTILLKLPIASEEYITWSDAIFTSTSAVTVTGLIVKDTGAAFSVFGEAVIMLLIQLGGMGLMTFAVVVLSSFGMRVGLTQRKFLQEEMGLSSVGGILDLAWTIFRIVFFCELVGFILLSFVFVPDLGWASGMWQALFHSISAFNNAGFSLFSDSLMGYSDSTLLMITISLQFMLGGLGFAVISDIFVSRNWSSLTLHTRLMLVGTVCLVVLSVVGYGLLEWTNEGTLGSLEGLGPKLNAAWFEGVTPRTAGFNSLDTSQMRESTTLMTIVLMIIGGGSTSTAGGIKVTTFVVLILATLAFFRSSGRMRAFGYSVGLEQGLKVMALLTVSVFVIVTGLFVLIVTHNFPFLDALFEVASAFGTVGLSRGITGELNDAGRAIICVIMFLGRLGPLTLGFFLATKRPSRLKYPEGTIYLG